MEAEREVAKEIVLVIYVEKLVTSIGIVPNVIQGLTAHPIGRTLRTENQRICQAIGSSNVRCTREKKASFVYPSPVAHSEEFHLERGLNG